MCVLLQKHQCTSSLLVKRDGKACQSAEPMPFLPVDDMLHLYQLFLVYSHSDMENKGKRVVDKIKLLYNLQSIHKFLRQAEQDTSQGTHNCSKVSAMLGAKSSLSLTLVRPPGSCKSSLIYENPFGNFLYLSLFQLEVYIQSLFTITLQLLFAHGPCPLP